MKHADEYRLIFIPQNNFFSPSDIADHCMMQKIILSIIPFGYGYCIRVGIFEVEKCVAILKDSFGFLDGDFSYA